MGRRVKPLAERKTSLFNFNCTDFDLIGNMYLIAKREGKSFGELVVHSLEEYEVKHLKGNFQTVFESYQEGGVKSEGQHEQEILRHFQGLNRELNYKDIIAKVKTDLGHNAKKARVTADNITRRLKEAGVKVWR